MKTALTQRRPLWPALLVLLAIFALVLWLGWLDTPLTAARSWVLDGMSTITWPLFELLARLFS